MQAILERLAAARINLLPLVEIATHWVFERDGFIALVERTPDNGFGRIGAPGLLTERGMAVLIHRGDKSVFVAKGFEQEAGAGQIEDLRRFARDLERALAG